MLSVIEFPDILSKIGSSDTRMALHTHEISQSQYYFLDLRGQLTRGREYQYLGLT